MSWVNIYLFYLYLLSAYYESVTRDAAVTITDKSPYLGTLITTGETNDTNNDDDDDSTWLGASEKITGQRI